MSAERIRELNDKFRANPYNGLGRFYVTHGVRARGQEFVTKCVAAVKAYDKFDEGNDPHKEHDFFAFDVDGVPLYFKVDYYDHSLKYGSPNPADPGVTTRIGTIMEQDEY